MKKILFDSWGYNMTIVDFYEVIKETSKTVTIKPIGSIETADGYLCGTAVPNPTVKGDDTFVARKRVFETLDGLVRTQKYCYRSSIGDKFGKVHTLFEWDGRPLYYNHCD